MTRWFGIVMTRTRAAVAALCAVTLLLAIAAPSCPVPREAS